MNAADIVRLTPEQAAATLAARLVLARTEKAAAEKQADWKEQLGQWGNTLKEHGSQTLGDWGQQANTFLHSNTPGSNAVLGGALGAGVGLGSSLMRDRGEHEPPRHWTSALIGGLAGAGIGGGLTYGAQHAQSLWGNEGPQQPSGDPRWTALKQQQAALQHAPPLSPELAGAYSQARPYVPFSAAGLSGAAAGVGLEASRNLPESAVGSFSRRPDVRQLRNPAMLEQGVTAALKDKALAGGIQDQTLQALQRDPQMLQAVAQRRAMPLPADPAFTDAAVGRLMGKGFTETTGIPATSARRGLLGGYYDATKAAPGSGLRRMGLASLLGGAVGEASGYLKDYGIDAAERERVNDLMRRYQQPAPPPPTAQEFAQHVGQIPAEFTSGGTNEWPIEATGGDPGSWLHRLLSMGSR